MCAISNEPSSSHQNDYKNFILNVRRPFVWQQCSIIKNLRSKTGNLEEWCRTFDAENVDGVNFNIANRENGKWPQWERHRQLKLLKLTEFYDEFVRQENRMEWATFGYKNINELPTECMINWPDFSDFGFPNRTDVTFWLGSTGANTPCHYDTYGCNIVVQLYGKKSWLLFPPDTRLLETRIPYEESSVYCKENFYSPFDLERFKHIEQFAHHCILEPGDVLIVPPKWWHFVENLEASLAINTWIPLKSDNQAQIDECLVKLKILEVIDGVPEPIIREIINPNEVEDLIDPSAATTYRKILDHLLQNGSNDPKRFENNFLTDKEISNLEHKLSEFRPIQLLSPESFRSILTNNSTRFNEMLKSGKFSDPAKRIIEKINFNCSSVEIMKFKNEYLLSLSK